MNEESSMAEHCDVPRSSPASSSEPHHGNQLQSASPGPERNDPQKPICSYSCLIGMALKRSESSSLSVNDIYNHLQEEFPYFKTVNTAAWKNSVRHCLSLGQYFRKVEQRESSELQSRKCFHWEVIPAKKEALEREISKYVSEEREERAQKEESHASRHHVTTGSSCYQIEQGTTGSSHQLCPHVQYTASAHCQLPLPQQSTSESILVNHNLVNPAGSSHTAAANCQHYDNRLQYSAAGYQNTATQYQSHETGSLYIQQQAHPTHLDTNSGIRKALLDVFAEIYSQANPDQNRHMPPAISPSGSESWQSGFYDSFLNPPQQVATQQDSAGYTGNSGTLPSLENSHLTGNFTNVSVGSIFNSRAAHNYDPFLDSQNYEPSHETALLDSLDPCPFCGLEAYSCQHYDGNQQDDAFDWLASFPLIPDSPYPVSQLETLDVHFVNEILEERGTQYHYDNFSPLCVLNTKPIITLCEVSMPNTEEPLVKQSTTAFNVTMHLRMESVSKRVLSDCFSALEGGNSFPGRTQKNKREATPVSPFYCNEKDRALDMSFYRTPLPRLDDPLIGSHWYDSLLEQSEALITPCDVQMNQNDDEQMLLERELVAEIFDVR